MCKYANGQMCKWVMDGLGFLESGQYAVLCTVIGYQDIHRHFVTCIEVKDLENLDLHLKAQQTPNWFM